jgi:hypothetical protein
MSNTYVKIQLKKDAKVMDCIKLLEHIAGTGLISGEPSILLDKGGLLSDNNNFVRAFFAKQLSGSLIQGGMS